MDALIHPHPHLPGPSASGADRFTVKQVDSLPRQRHRDDWIIRHGYAVNLMWTDRDEWFFYDRFEAAWVFLRAARMGEHIEGDISYAANEVRFHGSGGDWRTLHIGGPIRYWDIDEPKLLRHFVTQVDQGAKFAKPGQAPGAYPKTVEVNVQAHSQRAG